MHPRVLPKLSLRDIHVAPRASPIDSRSQVSLKADYAFRHSGQAWSGTPLILECRSLPAFIKKDYIHALPRAANRPLATGGLSPWMSQTDRYMLTSGLNDLNQVDSIVSRLKDQGTPLKLLCIDVENPYCKRVPSLLCRLRDRHPGVTLVSGPVACPEVVEALVRDGCVDIVRIGSERTMGSGVGLPQFSALLECGEVAREHGAVIANDSEITNVSDLPKAFCAGASFAVVHNPNDLLLEDAEGALRGACALLGARCIGEIGNNCTFYHAHM